MAISISGTTLTFNDNTTMTTASNGTVTSVATGNGLSGGTITTTGTLIIACPSSNSVGSYASAGVWTSGNPGSNYNLTFGSNYSAGSSGNQLQLALNNLDIDGYPTQPYLTNSLSGTWKWLGPTIDYNGYFGTRGGGIAIACRVS